MTNFDRIQGMRKDRLAEYLANYGFCHLDDEVNKETCKLKDCQTCIGQWLGQEIYLVNKDDELIQKLKNNYIKVLNNVEQTFPKWKKELCNQELLISKHSKKLKMMEI